MSKLVSPEELHAFLMSWPPEKLETESQEVKKYLREARARDAEAEKDIEEDLN